MSNEKRPPHPATVTVERAPHAATVQRREAPFGMPKVPPPHPATLPRVVVQPKAVQQRPPHPATVQRREGPFGVGAERPPHPATAIQRSAKKGKEEQEEKDVDSKSSSGFVADILETPQGVFRRYRVTGAPAASASSAADAYVKFLLENQQLYIKLADLEQKNPFFYDEKNAPASVSSVSLAFDVAAHMRDLPYRAEVKTSHGNPYGRYEQDKAVMILAMPTVHDAAKPLLGDKFKNALFVRHDAKSMQGYPPIYKGHVPYYLQHISPTLAYAVYETTRETQVAPKVAPPVLADPQGNPIHAYRLVHYTPPCEVTGELTMRSLRVVKCTNPKERDQEALMTAAANDIARQMGLPADPRAPHYGYEWLHLLAHSLIGHKKAQTKENLVLGTWVVNTQMMTFEEFVKDLLTLAGVDRTRVTVTTQPSVLQPAFLVPCISYRIHCFKRVEGVEYVYSCDASFRPLSTRRPGYIERELDHLIVKKGLLPWMPHTNQRIAAHAGAGGTGAAPSPGASSSSASVFGSSASASSSSASVFGSSASASSLSASSASSSSASSSSSSSAFASIAAPSSAFAASPTPLAPGELMDIYDD